MIEPYQRQNKWGMRTCKEFTWKICAFQIGEYTSPHVICFDVRGCIQKFPD